MNVLDLEKEKCTACGVCVKACPNNAVKLVTDKNGFKYPKINKEKCIECEICYKKCLNNTKIQYNTPKLNIAAMMKNSDKLKESTSGGLFSIFAEEILLNCGKVYGASLFRKKDGIYIEHIRIDNINDLWKIKGSKYVQSDISRILRLVKKDLDDDMEVLFSGTPCQIVALKSFLGKPYSNLITIDVICHGVSSYEFYSSYIKFLEKKYKGKVIEYKFRDKKNGGGHMSGRVTIQRNEKITSKKIIVPLDAYYKMFLQGEIYRDNCYKCKFAKKERVSDITVGDYWGINTENPEFLAQNGGLLDEEKGISCVLINTERGMVFFEKVKDNIFSYETTFEKISKNNHQLVTPSKYTEIRKQIFDIYKKNREFKDVNDWYMKKIGMKKYAYWIFNHLPLKLRKALKNNIV